MGERTTYNSNLTIFFESEDVQVPDCSGFSSERVKKINIPKSIITITKTVIAISKPPKYPARMTGAGTITTNKNMASIVSTNVSSSSLSFSETGYRIFGSVRQGLHFLFLTLI